MNLYAIKFTHYAPKDGETGIYGYILAANDESVYEWIKSEPKISDDKILYNSYEYYEEEKSYDLYDNNYDVIGTETFKERMIRVGGEMYDEDADVSDAYYGVTHLGWDLVKEDISEDEVKVLKGLGILQ